MKGTTPVSGSINPLWTADDVAKRCADAKAEVAWVEKRRGDAGTTSVKGKAQEGCPAPHMEVELSSKGQKAIGEHEGETD